MGKVTLLRTGISFLALQCVAQAALADDISDRIGRLEQEIAILKRQAEIQKEENAKKASTTPSVEVSQKGLVVQSADKNFQVKLGGFIQADARVGIHDKNDTTTDQFLIRRLRPTLEGKVYDNYSYRIVPDFGNGQTKLFDAYGDAAITPQVNIRVGKFKPAVSVEQYQSDTDGYFTERGLPSSLMPSRDIGLQLFGNVLDSRLEYQAALLNGTADGGNGDGDAGDGKEVALRLFATPFAKSNHLSLQKLGFGVAGTFGEKDGTASNTQLDVYKSPAQSTFFRYNSGTTNTVYADGTHKRLAPQFYYYWNSFGILGEYIISAQDVHVGSRTETLDNRAWGVTASYVLTGEDSSYKGLKPANNFDLKQGTWGALELVGRYGELTIDDKAFPLFADSSVSARKATEMETGLNWYLNESIRLMLSYDYTRFDGGAANGGDRADEQTLLTRVQYKF